MSVFFGVFAVSFKEPWGAVKHRTPSSLRGYSPLFNALSIKPVMRQSVNWACVAFLLIVL